MIHLDDCIQIIHKIIEKDCFGELFNACSNHHTTRREFYTYAKLKKGFSIPVFKKEETLQWKKISSDKIQRVLRYKFIYDNLLEI